MNYILESRPLLIVWLKKIRISVNLFSGKSNTSSVQEQKEDHSSFNSQNGKNYFGFSFFYIIYLFKCYNKKYVSVQNNMFSFCYH